MESGNRNIYGTLNCFNPARLVSIMKVQDIKTGLVDRLVLLDRLYVGNSGNLNDITGFVTITMGTAKSPTGTIKIVVSIRRIIEIVKTLQYVATITTALAQMVYREVTRGGMVSYTNS